MLLILYRTAKFIQRRALFKLLTIVLLSCAATLFRNVLILIVDTVGVFTLVMFIIIMMIILNL